MRDPTLMKELHKQIERYVSSIDYEEYRKQAGVKLAAQADRDGTAVGRAQAQARKLAGIAPKTDVEKAQADALKASRAAERHQKKNRLLSAQVRGRIDFLRSLHATAPAPMKAQIAEQIKALGGEIE
jgi:hypothetical protein